MSAKITDRKRRTYCGRQPAAQCISVIMRERPRAPKRRPSAQQGYGTPTSPPPPLCPKTKYTPKRTPECNHLTVDKWEHRRLFRRAFAKNDYFIHNPREYKRFKKCNV